MYVCMSHTCTRIENIKQHMLCSTQHYTMVQRKHRLHFNKHNICQHSHGATTQQTYRIAETGRGLLGKDGTGGDGPAEKLGDVGQSGATIGSGLEGGGRIGRKEGGRGHDGGGKNEAGHDFAYCIDICGKGSVKQTDLGFTKSNRG